MNQGLVVTITECPQSKAEAVSTIEKVAWKLQWFEWGLGIQSCEDFEIDSNTMWYAH